MIGKGQGIQAANQFIELMLVTKLVHGLTVTDT